MATVTAPPVMSRDESQRRVAGPLQRLSGSIRWYVIVEGTAVILLYLSLWFWIGLLLDYGVFKAGGFLNDHGLLRPFGLGDIPFDWVQLLPFWFRAGVLALLVAGLLAVAGLKVVLRVVREFRAPALALVLERRFPKLLGDRLITAVELADPRMASRYGYSQVMVEQTIREAADLVAQIPVGEVFDWKRLRRKCYWVAALSAGVYLLAGLVFHGCQFLSSEDQKRGREGFGAFALRFNQVAGIWLERNVLLKDTPWPRRAYLVVLDFPGASKHISRDEASQQLRVRALKWVVADSDRTQAAEGWRPLRWSDLDKFLPKVPPPAPPFGADPTVDEVDFQLAMEGGPRAGSELEELFKKLETLADTIGMSRRLRKLEIPGEIKVIYKGETLSGEPTAEKLKNANEYTLNLPELKESIDFRARGADYYTPYKRIEVVSPPQVNALTLGAEQPAYLFYRADQSGPGGLRGLKQKMPESSVLLQGDVSRLDVPAGSHVVLTATSDKDLRVPGGVRIKPAPGAEAGPVSSKVEIEALCAFAGMGSGLGGVSALPSLYALPSLHATSKEPSLEQVDPRTFRARFENVTAPIDIVFDLTDTDNVIGSRRVFIKPIDDLPPDVDVQAEVVRKTNDGYLITPSARVPFRGRIHDDHGITRVEYAYQQSREEKPSQESIQQARQDQAQAGARAVLALTVWPLARGCFGPSLTALAHLSTGTRPADKPEPAKSATPLDTFTALDKKMAQSGSPPRLGENPPESSGLVKDFTLSFNPDSDADADSEVFDVERLGLKVSEQNAIQPHYTLRLWVSAADSNVDTGPSIGESKEKFTFRIVSEFELLAEIGKEEEGLHVKLEDAISSLKAAQIKLEIVLRELPSLQKAEEFVAKSVQTKEAEETVVKSGDAVREVFADYRRIFKELKANRVEPTMVKRVEKIRDLLKQACQDDFPAAELSSRAFLKTLDVKGRDAQAANRAIDDLRQLIARLNQALDEMGKVISVNELIRKIVEIEKEESIHVEKLQKLHKHLTDIILEGLEGDKK